MALRVLRRHLSKRWLMLEVPPPLVSKELKRRWSHFIQKVYETDLLIWVFYFRNAPKPAKTQFNSSLIESWGSKTQQTQAQSGSETK